MESKHIAIIGSGPAGIAAAIQLKRYEFQPDVFEKDRVGGLLWNANLVENYPGFPSGISGPDLISLMVRQLEKYSIFVNKAEVTGIKKKDNEYLIRVNEKYKKYDYVIVATGTKPKKVMGIPGLDSSDHIHHDIRDILSCKDLRIVIVGNGDAAFDQAINLSRSNEIVIINRNKNIKCLSFLSKLALNSSNIKYLDNTVITKIEKIEEKEINANHLMIQVETKLKSYSIECDELVFAIGRYPDVGFVDQGIEGKKLLFAGDVHNGLFRQTSIAVGEGVMAAMKIHKMASRGEE